MSGWPRHIWRLLLIFAGGIFIFLMIYATLRLTIYSSFVRVERQQALDAMGRCEAALNSEISRISAMCHDWGMWDDAYKYVKDKNESFIAANLSNTLFDSNQLNMICFAKIDGEIIFSDKFDLESKANFKLKDMTGTKVQGDFLKMLRLQSPDSRLSGFITTEKGHFIAISNPVLTTHGQGPILGAIIMGRLVDKKLVDEMSEKTGLHIEMLPGVKNGLKGEALPLSGEKYSIRELSHELLNVEWTVKDINGNSAFAFSINIKRNITRNGTSAIWLAMLILIGLGTIVTAMIHLFLGRNFPSEEIAFRHGWSVRSVLIIMVILVFGSSLSAFMYHVFKKNEADSLIKDFERNEAAPVVAGIEQKLQTLEDNIDSTIRLFETDEHVNREEFRNFTAKVLERNRDVKAFDWVPRVLRGERSDYESKASEELNREFHFTEKSPDGRMVVTGERDEYFPVYYFEPRAGNLESAGLDNYSEPTRKAMLDKSRSTGQRILAVNLKLVQDKSKKPGFLLFNPVYKGNIPVDSPENRFANIMGFVVMVFHMDDTVGSMLSDSNHRNLSLEISDAGEGGSEKAIIYSDGEKKFGIYKGGEVVRKFDFGGRSLLVRCWPTMKYVKEHTGRTPYYVMSIGLLITIVMTLLVYSHIQGTLKESER
ncbi:MAG TPA: hypothetical protein DCZ94_11200 [Lentisphaeria bacterium]|nr:MAG: hypothetical protein A2X48_07080 [Lentisphaerae bacterium GWF2_49_21]HBC87512.1 hypothetical protein [Lentisphaeria bacterium]